MTVLEQLATDGYVGNVNGGDAQTQFQDGKAPFFLSGPWQLAGFDELGIPYGVAKLPTMEGQAMRPFLGAGGWFINQFSENVGIAEAFLLDYIATDDAMLALYEADPRNRSSRPRSKPLRPTTRSQRRSRCSGPTDSRCPTSLR